MVFTLCSVSTTFMLEFNSMGVSRQGDLAKTMKAVHVSLALSCFERTGEFLRPGYAAFRLGTFPVFRAQRAKGSNSHDLCYSQFNYCFN